MRETHAVELAGLKRELPLFEVAPGVRIAVFNMLGDTEIVEACARALAERMPPGIDTLVTAEAKSIPLAHALSAQTGVPYIVLRKSWKPYMGETLTTTTRSITTGREQTLHLDAKDRPMLSLKNVALLDDVISTGSTLEGMRGICAQAGAKVAATLAVFTEGKPRADVQSLGHLPVFG